MNDIVIIGAGTAGLTSAIYALRAGKNVKVLNGGILGGQITQAAIIENYPGILNISGVEFAEIMRKQVQNSGGEIINEKAEIINADEKTINEKYKYDTLIIATGQIPKKLGFEDEFIGSGVSYCATCDGNFFRGKDVFVAGGGNSALSEALFLSDICNSVTVIHRRDTFRADEIIVEKCKQKGKIKYMLNTVITGLSGNGRLEKIITKDNEIKAHGLFIAIGHEPDCKIYRNILKTDDNGYIMADSKCRTSREGIFAAGDCIKKDVRQLTTAAADGTIAAIEAIKHLEYKNIDK